jgi:voltage-dependent potassium channel beta subunit
MEYRNLGNSGLRVSSFSFGSWVTFAGAVDAHAATECLRIAYDAGVNFFDNAEGYAQGKSELVMGEALKRLGWRRDSYTVSSKVMFGSVAKPSVLQRGLSRKHVTEACHQAMERLGVDYLDLYFCHRPDKHTPIEETVRTMNTLIEQGKVLYWGTSEWSVEQLQEAYRVAEKYNLIGPTMEQPEYSLFARSRVEQEYAPLYEEHGLGTTIWSPLCSGVLTGKYNNGVPDDSRANLPGYEWLADNILNEKGQRRVEATRQLSEIAAQLGMSMTHLALAWTQLNPHVSTTILGASSAAQLTDNLAAVQQVEKLTPDVVGAVEAVLLKVSELE